MPERNPILITGAAGEIGGVSRTMVDMLLEQGHPVRAFVRQDDERAHSLRQAGAEVFVGDLLTIADVTAALKGVRRIYFSMSLSPYYTDAVSLMAAAARAQGDIEVFVNISEYEQSFMTFDRMTAPEEERRVARRTRRQLVAAATGPLGRRAGAGVVRRPDRQRAGGLLRREPHHDLAGPGLTGRR
ncbi:NAD(P)H-binding protein [Streptomyces bobili]|uniref:NmrA family NAD(P)-binding protein n=1 Tax=Streptomyces bobili TaxID=67280 RepID=UPI001FC907CF|nr:NAD(P)H-binding protein [Streptomyces bobili]